MVGAGGFVEARTDNGNPSRTLDVEIGMSPRVALSLAVIASALSTGAVHAEPRAVIELFTSHSIRSEWPITALSNPYVELRINTYS